MDVEITRSGSQPSAKGPADWFTGSVRIDAPFQRPAPARVSGATVTFEPGARTAWHTHPLGQTLIVTAGCGRVQREGGPIEEIRAGDIGGSAAKALARRFADNAMTHIASAECDGKVVEWNTSPTSSTATGKCPRRRNQTEQCDVAHTMCASRPFMPRSSAD
jgi:hypothetical protein